eukprot:PhM_4_TR18094/c6_g1_i1/m.49176
MGWGFRLGLVVLLLALQLRTTFRTIELFKPLPTFTDAGHSCHLVNNKNNNNNGGFEDLAVISDTLAISGSDDRHSLWEAVDGAETTPPGALFLLEDVAKDVVITKMELVGIDAATARRFHPHGLYVAKDAHGSPVTTLNPDGRYHLWVVTHGYAFDKGEAILHFILDINAKTATLQKKMRPGALTQVHGAVNDVVVVNGDVYVTQWLPHGHPQHGRKNPVTVWDYINRAITPMQIINSKSTQAFRCTTTTEEEELEDVMLSCQAMPQFYGMANGITRTRRGELLVVDVMANTVTVVHPTTMQTLHVIHTPNGFDNLELHAHLSHTHDDDDDDDVDVFVSGSILHKAESFKVMGTLKPAPGGADRVSLRRHMKTNFTSTTAPIIYHDGGVLPVISSGFVGKYHTLFGSPYNAGIMVCDSPLKGKE